MYQEERKQYIWNERKTSERIKCQYAPNEISIINRGSVEYGYNAHPPHSVLAF